MENPCNPSEQQNRQDQLEAAYIQSGRKNGLYTGLLTKEDDNNQQETTGA